jgi:hypothetical protein
MLTKTLTKRGLKPSFCIVFRNTHQKIITDIIHNSIGGYSRIAQDSNSKKFWTEAMHISQVRCVKLASEGEFTLVLLSNH